MHSSRVHFLVMQGKSMESIFKEGISQDIPAVLAAKDKRVQMQKAIFAKYPASVLVDVNMNIPGPIKNNQYLQKMFKLGTQELEKKFKQNKLQYKLVASWNETTGSENFYIINDKINYVKKIAIDFEDSSDLGRLFDADVLVKDQQMAISRKDLGLPVRKCFLCSRPAKDCSRSRRHSVEDLQEYISQVYFENFS